MSSEDRQDKKPLVERKPKNSQVTQYGKTIPQPQPTPKDKVAKIVKPSKPKDK